ncbi:N-acetyltransferase, partial [Burkholderia pseudomallei]
MDRAHRCPAGPVDTLLDGLIAKYAYYPRRIGGAMRVHALGDHAVVNCGLATDTVNLVICRAADGAQAYALAPIASEG